MSTEKGGFYEEAYKRGRIIPVSKPTVLEIRKLWNNIDSTVRLYSNTKGADFVFKGFIESGLQLSGQNTWVTDLEGATSGVGSMVRKAIAGGAMFDSVRDTSLYKSMASTGIKSVHETLNSYSGSTSPVFPIQALVLAYDNNMNVLEQCINLMSMVLPYKQGNFTMINPLRYIPALSSNNLDELLEFANNSESIMNKPEANQAGQGTLNLAIGRYFFGGGFICQDIAIGLSKEVVEDGTHLYATVNFTVKPKIMPDYFQYRRYFKGINYKSFGGGEQIIEQGFNTIENTQEAAKKALETLVVDPLVAVLEGMVSAKTKLLGGFADQFTVKPETTNPYNEG